MSNNAHDSENLMDMDGRRRPRSREDAAAADYHDVPRRSSGRIGDDRNGAAGAASTAATGGAGAAGAVPLRGLAMVLIAVAILLVLWGVYAVTNKGGDNAGNTAAETTSSVAGAPAISLGAPTDAASPSEGAPGEDPTSPTSVGYTAVPQPAVPVAPAPAPAPAPSPAPAPAPAAPSPNLTVNVLNNSTEQGLAGSVAELLKQRGYAEGTVGNLPGSQAKLSENTVFFDPANPAAEPQARDLATRVNGVARPNDGTVGATNEGINALTVVLVRPING